MQVKNINDLDWNKISLELDNKGYCCISKFLSKVQCESLISLYEEQDIYRKTVVMERYRFGLGVYKYFNYPLPSIVQTLRRCLYPKLMPIANTWMQRLNINIEFPKTYEEFKLECHSNEQLYPTPLILKYEKGGFNTLHQDLYGEIFFPLQAILCLSEPELDFTGGEIVLTQQAARMQSKAIVLTPNKGDMIILSGNFRPVCGTRGYYKMNMKHGVSEIQSGIRYSAGIIFHDAIS